MALHQERDRCRSFNHLQKDIMWNTKDRLKFDVVEEARNDNLRAAEKNKDRVKMK